MKDNQEIPKKEPGGTTNGMLHRSPDINCPLCQIWGVPWDEDDPDTWGKQHIYAEKLWKEWNPRDKTGKWVANVIAAAASLDPPVVVDEKTVKDHFGKKHRIEQPMLSDRISHEEALFEAQSLPEESRQIIEAVFRMKCMTTSQITEVFFRPEKPVGKTAQNAATRLLNTLASSWNLYRYMPSPSDSDRKNAMPNMNKTAVWFLGKPSVPLIQERYQIDQRFYPHYLNRARDIDINNLAHDLRSVDVFVSMIKELNQMNPGKTWSEGKEIESKIAGIIDIWPLVSNWYGPGINLLPIGYVDPMSGEARRILPDGFASISIMGSDKEMPDCQLPFFIEYDNDSKTVGEVVEQLLSYHLMGISGASKRRFPDLDADNYIPPVLMVFSRKNRVKIIAKKFQEKAEELGISSGAPIFLAAEEDWRRGPFSNDTSISVWDEDLKDNLFIDLLISSSRQLIKSEKLEPDQTLALDPKAAPARSDKKKQKLDREDYFKNMDFDQEPKKTPIEEQVEAPPKPKEETPSWQDIEKEEIVENTAKKDRLDSHPLTDNQRDDPEEKTKAGSIADAVQSFAGSGGDLEPDLPGLDGEKPPTLGDIQEETVQEESEDVAKEPLATGPITSKDDLPSLDDLSKETGPAYEENRFLNMDGASADYPSLEGNVGSNMPIPEPRPEQSPPVEIYSFDPENPLVPNNLVDFNGAPVYNPGLNQEEPKQEERDLNYLPADSPIRKEVEMQAVYESEQKQPFVAAEGASQRKREKDSSDLTQPDTASPDPEIDNLTQPDTASFGRPQFNQQDLANKAGSDLPVDAGESPEPNNPPDPPVQAGQTADLGDGNLARPEFSPVLDGSDIAPINEPALDENRPAIKQDSLDQEPENNPAAPEDLSYSSEDEVDFDAKMKKQAARRRARRSRRARE